MTDGSRLEVSAQGDREILFTRVFAAPREAVFDAHVTPELVRRWMIGLEGMSLPVCEIDPREGGALRFVWRRPDGTEMGMSGVHHQVERPSRLVHTELFDQDWTGGEAVATTVFEAAVGGTVMTITMRYVSRQARDAVLASGMSQGMAMCYDRLDKLLASTADGA
ncbi:MAG TPA: SRPBCC family protein [Geminicoccus sp.]|uniref:SRPBCC family protein n=1 Tax=Geminicoccus sp. TaxID=2024832 RepID=UPI002E2ECA56|nr:SRPBCC family protein [Geminicoccus sp.]HEX2525233.1 SRPBCC family protein [Geminicoccus sp.]